MNSDYSRVCEEFAQILAQSPRVTVLSHQNPDSDAIGTSLGIYHWLKSQGKRVEVANVSREIPHYLDFLPSYARIKHTIDYDDSLIIACDSGSLDRLGFDLEGRTIINIDHHPTNTRFGTINIVDPQAVSSSQIAYEVLSRIHPVMPESATAFYAALISDTRNFTTNNVDASTFELAQRLVAEGVHVSEVTRQMLHRRSLASLRVLGAAIDSLELRHEGRLAVMMITQDDLARTGAKSSDLDGIVDYARSLATVEIAVMLVERSREIKVSLRSKHVDVSGIARHFGGGGHAVAAGFEVAAGRMDRVRDALIDVMERRGVLG